MLWKKETPRPDALYEDLFASCGTEHMDQIFNFVLEKANSGPYPKKSDEIAFQKRNEGNMKFRACDWLNAMELYGDSLRYAKPGSEHISLAYANRSACFLKLQMYDECLTDIEYAMTAGYPEHLRPKLDERKKACLTEMQKNDHTRRKLITDSDEKFPYLSNVAQVQRNGKGEYSVVAQADIDVGEVICVENAYYAYLWDRFGGMCHICAKQCCNIVPCKTCAVAMFCPDCQGHFLHEHECGLYLCNDKILNSSTMGLVRDILLIQKAFPNADELMKFVEKIQTKPTDLPDNLLDGRSKFQALFNSPIQNVHHSIDKIVFTVYPVYKTIMRIPHINEMYKMTKHQRFLMHLIAHLGKIGGGSTHVDKSIRNPDGNHLIYRVKLIMRAYFQESCCPNVFEFARDGKTVWYSVKSIKKDEKLFISKLPVEDFKSGMAYVWSQLKSTCKCPQCKGKTLSPAQREQLTSDPAYRFIESCEGEQVKSEQLKSLMEAYMAVLRQYGQWNWCEEIRKIINKFNVLQYNSMAGGINAMIHPLTLARFMK